MYLKEYWLGYECHTQTGQGSRLSSNSGRQAAREYETNHTEYCTYCMKVCVCGVNIRELAQIQIEASIYTDKIYVLGHRLYMSPP